MYERDGGVCQLCGHPVCSSEFQLDHIIPKCDGGEFTWSNLRLAHKRCNASRSHGRRPTPAIEDSRKNGPPPDRYTEFEEAQMAHYERLHGNPEAI
jgi:5-methylcytosine-specific restriction endonuclease McrA